MSTFGDRALSGGQGASSVAINDLELIAARLIGTNAASEVVTDLRALMDGTLEPEQLASAWFDDAPED